MRISCAAIVAVSGTQCGGLIPTQVPSNLDAKSLLSTSANEHIGIRGGGGLTLSPMCPQASETIEGFFIQSLGASLMGLLIVLRGWSALRHRLTLGGPLFGHPRTLPPRQSAQRLHIAMQGLIPCYRTSQAEARCGMADTGRPLFGHPRTMHRSRIRCSSGLHTQGLLPNLRAFTSEALSGILQYWSKFVHAHPIRKGSMSGVVGYWSYSSADLAAAVFAEFTHSLAHRGPDGFGIEHFPGARLWLGHRRLAIVDLSERARQPMSYAEGRYWLTYNGEVYNYVELREELRGLGHRFISDSDSEVILAAYAQWGQDCQFRFNGMWAFAIWDAREHRLFLSRDRFGVKPLHYCDHAGAFVFASELKAFLTLPWIDGAFDPEILAETLADVYGQEATPDTLLPGVRRLPAGHAMLVEADGSIRINAWWNTLDHLPQPRASLDEQAEEFRALFFDACRLRLRSDVPLATALSGGLDSSAIACTLAELGRRGVVEHAPKDWQRAFVACFTGTPYDERLHVKAVVDHTGMMPCYLDVDDHQALENIERVIFDHEKIYWFPPVGSWTLYRAMCIAGIRVSIDGQGSDEMIGGYHLFVEGDGCRGRISRPPTVPRTARCSGGLVGGT